MTFKKIRVCQWALAASAPLVVYAFSTGPPIERTGAPSDGGLNCTACHRTFAPANSGAGRVIIRSGAYTPGVKQNIQVMVEDPDARRWGFQLTARMHSDETKEAGTFSAINDLRVRCAPDGHDGPCNGEREFIEHTQPATAIGTRGSHVFTVEWTPPAQDVGEVIFYAAGNAADGNGTNANDRIYTTSAVIRPACNLSVKPSLSSVVDAASLRTAIAWNGLISILGGPFMSSPGTFSLYKSDLDNGKLPTAFGCVAVEVGGQRAPVFFVSKDQINAQVPLVDAGGPVDVQVVLNPGSANEVRSAAVKTQLNLRAPAFFTWDGSSILGFNETNDNRNVGSASLPNAAPARPGDVVVLYLTGCGLTDPVYQPGEYPDGEATIPAAVTLTIGEKAVAAGNILYPGASPVSPGIYELRVRLPQDLPDGDLPVVLGTGAVQTQPGAIIPVKRQ